MAGAIDAGLRDQLERPDRHFTGVLLDAVDVQVQRRWHRHFAEEGRQRRGHAVGLEAEVAADADATDAYRAGPAKVAAGGVAEAQAEHRFRERPFPAGIKANAVALPLPARVAAKRARDRKRAV